MLDTQTAAASRLGLFLRWIAATALTISGLGIVAITWIAMKERTREPLAGSDASPIHFDQSQFAGAVLSGGQLRRIAADYIPRLSDDGLLRRRTFELMDGSASLEEIAYRLAAEFPKRFSSWQQALSYAGLISQEFSR